TARGQFEHVNVRVAFLDPAGSAVHTIGRDGHRSQSFYRLSSLLAGYDVEPQDPRTAQPPWVVNIACCENRGTIGTEADHPAPASGQILGRPEDQSGGQVNGHELPLVLRGSDEDLTVRSVSKRSKGTGKRGELSPRGGVPEVDG